MESEPLSATQRAHHHGWSRPASPYHFISATARGHPKPNGSIEQPCSSAPLLHLRRLQSLAAPAPFDGPGAPFAVALAIRGCLPGAKRLERHTICRLPTGIGTRAPTYKPQGERMKHIKLPSALVYRPQSSSINTIATSPENPPGPASQPCPRS